MVLVKYFEITESNFQLSNVRTFSPSIADCNLRVSVKFNDGDEGGELVKIGDSANQRKKEVKQDFESAEFALIVYKES